MSYRPTGIGAFGFSLNWEKVPGDEDIARRVVTFLEDRRLLFGERHSGRPIKGIAAVLKPASP